MDPLLFVKKVRSRVPPYPDRDPVPPSVPSSERHRLKTSFVEIKCQKIHPDCPYTISTTDRTVHRTPKGKEQEVKDVREYTYCCAIVFAPWNPGDDYGEPGDIWVNTGAEKAVWVVNGKGKCIQWPGNNSTEQVEHPWFPGLHIWYGGVNSWNWWDRDKNLRSTRSRQTHGQTAFAAWLKDKGRGILPDSGKVNLGSDVDAVEHWLEIVAKERLPAVEGPPQARQDRKRSKDERTGPAERPVKRMKEEPARVPRPSLDVEGPIAGPSSRGGREPIPSNKEPVIQTSASPKERGDEDDPIKVDSSPGPSRPIWEIHKDLIVMSPDPEDLINVNTPEGIIATPRTEPTHDPSPSRAPQTEGASSSSVAGCDSRASAYQRPPLEPEGRPEDNIPSNTSVDPKSNPETARIRNRSPTPPPETRGASASAYQPPPLDCCIGDRPGKEWPAGSEECTWPNGMRTVLPFVKSDRTSFNMDSEAVKNMARSAAVPMNVEDNDSPVVYVRLDNGARKGIAGLTSDGKSASAEERRVLDAMERAFCQGKAAVVDGWAPGGPQIEFDEPGLTSLQANLEGMYQWQCARQRDARRPKDVRPPFEHSEGDSQGEEGSSTQGRRGSPSRDIYKTTSLREFVKRAKEPDECGNILDAPAIDGEVPWFVSRLSDDQIAWRVTKDMGFSQAAKSLYQDAILQNPDTEWKMNLDALRDTKNLNKLTPDVLEEKIGENADDCGPQNLGADSLALRHWDLITMGGFYTFPHYDANGYGTWVNVRSGGKFWGFRDFKDDDVKRGTRGEIVNLYRSMESGDEQIIGYTTNKGYCLFLHEGLTLVMPPGMVHEVYTSVNTMATGGHFLNYKFMHMTQWCRYVDRTIKSSLTNAEHSTIGRSLSRMVLALTKCKRVIPKRSFLALAHMIMAPQLYQSRRYREEAYAPFAWEDLEEWKEARRIVQEILIVKGEELFGSNDASMDMPAKALKRLTDQVGDMSLVAGPKWKRCEELDTLDLSYLVA